MATFFKRPGIVRVTGAVILYWCVLLCASLVDFEAFWAGSLVLPVLLLSGLPLLALTAATIWRSANLREGDLAFLDDLTGLHNRRAFTRRATALLHKAKPGAASLILIDVDGLKSINDECGHQAGDELLEQVARHLAAVSSAVYRVGGDEFAILVNRSEGESVTGLMRSLTPLSHKFKVCGHEHLIQFSYGFASRREHETFDQIFQRADSRLRQFKNRLYSSGRARDRRGAVLNLDASIEEIVDQSAHVETEGNSTVVSIFSRAGKQKTRSETGTDTR